MHHIGHIAAFWLHKAMQVPGGHANEARRVEYWSCIAQYNSANLLCGGRV